VFGIREHRGIDVDHDLVSLARVPPDRCVVERRSASSASASARCCAIVAVPSQRPRETFPRNVFVYHAGGTLAVNQGLACRGQSLLRIGARLRSSRRG